MIKINVQLSCTFRVFLEIRSAVSTEYSSRKIPFEVQQLRCSTKLQFVKLTNYKSFMVKIPIGKIH